MLEVRARYETKTKKTNTKKKQNKMQMPIVQLGSAWYLAKCTKPYNCNYNIEQNMKTKEQTAKRRSTKSIQKKTTKLAIKRTAFTSKRK